MEIKLNKDLNTYKTKDIFLFSFKECGFAALGIFLFFIGKSITKPVFPNSDLPVFLGIMFALPPLLIGFFKPRGYSFMDYLKLIWFPNLSQTKEKRWVSDFDENIFEEFYSEGEEKNEEIKP